MTTLAQPQLIQGALSPGDVVYTPDWCAKDMVDWFKPDGAILEPSIGGNAIYKFLPKGSEWCEIEAGRDFFKWDKQVDWIVGNPPYSLMSDWLKHSYVLSENIVYLIPLDTFFLSMAKMRECKKYGWVAHIRVYGVGTDLGFPTGKTMGAFHFVRGYKGPTYWSWYEMTPRAPARAGEGE